MKEYIILDSNNNWLSTDTNKEYALKMFEKIKRAIKNEEETFGETELGNEIYLFEAKELRRFEL